jgi:hypothetical protein
MGEPQRSEASGPERAQGARRSKPARARVGFEFALLLYNLVLWMFSASPEILAAVAVYDPTYVNTSEVPLVRRWLER